MKKQLVYFGSFMLLSFLFVACAVLLGKLGEQTLPERYPAGAEKSAPLIVIDPGHGGEDGGCVSDKGEKEKDLNLRLAQTLADILRAQGCSVEMTRTEDKMLYDMYDDRKDYKGYKKIFDLKNRLRFTREREADVFIGIHMNKFPSEKYSGLQVYYSPNNDGSAGLAELIRSYNARHLQPENTRQTKPAGTSIFLLNRLEIPAVLVECGFLSNREEAALLQDEGYRKRMALVIASAAAEYCASME